MPHVAAIYGGLNARVLSILRDPGPATQQGKGSGVLCLENDDATAERYSRLLVEAGLPASELVPWNAYQPLPRRSPRLVRVPGERRGSLEQDRSRRGWVPMAGPGRADCCHG